MKTKYIVIMLFCFLILVPGSCKKDGEDDLQTIPEELFGSWAHHEIWNWPAQDEDFYFRFSKTDALHGTYEFLWQKEYPVENNIISPGAERGSFVIRNERITPSPTAFGSQLEINTGDLLNGIEWYSKDDPEFKVFESIGSTFYAFAGDTLKLSEDFDLDGTPDIVTSYIRENWTMPD
jgi:hypothetical protein